MVIKFFLFCLSLFGWKPSTAPPVKAVPPTSSARPVRPRIRTEAQEIRDAVTTLDRFERAGTLGVKQPTKDEADAAWLVIENRLLPVAGYLRACTHLQLSWPLCPRGADPDVWVTAVLEKVGHETDKVVVTAIFGGCVLRAWRAVENVMARYVEHGLRGCTPVVVYAGGPVARREVHVRDSVRSGEHPNGRVIVARAYEHGRGGRLEVLDRDGAELSQETVSRSGWTLCDGWIAVVGPVGGRRPPDDEGDAPREEHTPPASPRR